MKKGLLIIAFLCFSLGFSQTGNNEKAANDFQTAFNASNYEAIFNMYNDNMKAQYSLDETISFYKRIHSVLGDIKLMSFQENKGKSSVYETTFSKEVMEVEIDLDIKSKVNKLYLRKRAKALKK